MKIQENQGPVVKMIGAHGLRGEFGNKNDLPGWKLSADFQHFKNLTTGQVVVMGERCFLSLPEKFRPLPNRTNVVLTLDTNFKQDGVLVFNNLDTLLESFKNAESIWVIGGAGMYKTFLNKGLIDEIYETVVEGEFEADVFFPAIDYSKWQLISESRKEKDDKNSHNIIWKVWRKYP